MSAELLKKYSGLYESLEILNAVSTGASAYLLSGEDAEGLNVLARLLAARLSGLPYSRAFDDYADIQVYPKPDAKQKSTKGKKPEAEKQKRYAIGVDDIRELIGSLYLTPFELDRRVYIIEGAESMSEICQNKLLKSLEEPPRSVCFILCASGALLPTVESRCNKIELAPFPVDVAERALAANHADKKAVALAARASRGNLGMAERILADKDFGAVYSAAIRILELSGGSKMFGAEAAVYDKLTRERMRSVLGVMEYILNDIARLAVGLDTVFDANDVRRCAAGFTPYSAAACAEHVRAAGRKIDANCMPIAVMDRTILNIMEENALCRR